MPRNAFSFASVVMSFFLVAGGIVLGLIGFAVLKQPSQPLFFAAFGLGAFVGGFVAARASAGSTIIEPALGSILLVGSVVAMGAATPVGKILWAVASEQVGRTSGIIGGVAIAGALIGAFLSEKLFGEATTSSIPWVIYTALATCGACLIAWMVAIAILLQDMNALQTQAAREKGGVAFLAGIGAGCLLSGLAVGASSRRRALLGSLLGAAVGALGFFLLILEMEGGSGTDQEGAKAGLAIIAAGGGVVTLIGNVIGWSMFGKRHADA
jgi:hypothetical protein